VSSPDARPILALMTSPIGPSLAAITASPERLLRRPLPFAGGGARHKVGARNVGLDSWLELTGDDVAGQLGEKARLLEARRDDVLQALPGSGEACEELLDLVREAAHGASPALPLSPLPAGLHPLEEAGRLVPEDFCVHLPDPATGGLVLVAGCVCFPNRWRLADKVGRAVTAVHGPVPHYANQLGRPVDRLMERLAQERVMERANWGLVDGPELFAPVSRDAKPGAEDELVERLWLRIERQTLRRLPRTRAVVFTIRTLQAPVDVLRSDPEAAALLARAISELPVDVAIYKLGSEAVRQALLRSLDAL
jgi:dimethylamine monooxygenase subunit A